ncbi:MAG: hypothetical protein HC814_05655, partial [Rhodobacteraceae bacterium]|nr:hypothetical protein [Paracoccaceae bacterium]
MRQRIALIGAGAIGSALLRHLQDDPLLSVAQVIVRESRLSECKGSFGSRYEFIADLKDLSPDIDVVFECAGHDAVRQFGPAVLRRGVDFALASVGALADPRPACIPFRRQHSLRRAGAGPAGRNRRHRRACRRGQRWSRHGRLYRTQAPRSWSDRPQPLPSILTRSTSPRKCSSTAMRRSPVWRWSRPPRRPDRRP